MAGQETHSGAIYTAVVSLKLLGRLELVSNLDDLQNFLVFRQSNSGINGRINKDPDSCYSFWVQASLKALGLPYICNEDSTREFLLSCQSPSGGFNKYPVKPSKMYPDIFHSYYSLCGLCLLGEGSLLPIDCLGLTMRACASSTFHNGTTATNQKYFDY